MCALWAMHKSQLFPPSMNLCAVNTPEHGNVNQITTNIRFLLPTAAILEQLTKGLFRTLDSRRHKTPSPHAPQCFSHTWIYLFFHVVFSIPRWWGRGVSFCSKTCAASRSAVLAGRRWALWGLNKQLWHMGRTYSTASHWSSRGD